MSARLAALLGLGCALLALLQAVPAWRAVHACGPPGAEDAATARVEVPARSSGQESGDLGAAGSVDAERS